MPTRPLTDEQCRHALQMYRENGDSYKLGMAAHNEIAEARGDKIIKSDGTFRNRVLEARRRGFHLSEGAQEQINRAGLSGVEAKGGWKHDYDADGKKLGTTRWAAPEFAVQEETLERIKSAFSDIDPLPKVKASRGTVGDLMGVLSLFDVHWNMQAWAEETGGVDYNIKLAREDMMRSLETLLEDAPKADTLLLIIGGDFLHTNGHEPFTGSRNHPLDVDGAQYKAIETGIAIIKYAVNRCLEHYNTVKVLVLRGNHDTDSHLTIAFALKEWLAKNERASVEMSASDVKMFQWGRAAIFAQHGDKMKPEQLALRLSDVCKFWSECTHRYAYTGHKHQMAAQRIGGLNWERLEPFAPGDAYGASWVNRRAMKIDTYHKQRGRIGTVMDPIERD